MKHPIHFIMASAVICTFIAGGLIITGIVTDNSTLRLVGFCFQGAGIFIASIPMLAFLIMLPFEKKDRKPKRDDHQ